MLGDLIEAIISSKRDIFPIVDDEKNLKGIVYLNDVRSLIFDEDLYDKISIRELMHIPSVTVSIHEHMEEVVRKFQSANFYNLPVHENGKYKGFVSRANLFSAYRKMLKAMSEE